MRPCFAFNAAASAEEPSTLMIFDEIGFWGVQAKDFVEQLRGVKSKVLNVEINSPGGDVHAGLAIYNALRASGKEVVTKVMGVAASAASLILMAGDKRVAPKNTFVMVHNPWTFAMGNADELRETADTLDKIGSSLLHTYVSRAGVDEGAMKDMLAKDTWLTADEAREHGFITEVVEDVEARASFDMERADLPEKVRAVFASAKPKAQVEPQPQPQEPVESAEPAAEVVAEVVEDDNPTEQIVALAKASGMEDLAPMFALQFSTLDAAKARMSEVREMRALGKVANKVDMANAAIKAGTSVKDLRAQMVKAMAEEDEITHTSGAPKASASNQGAGNSANPPVSTETIWDSHNKQTRKK